MAVALLSLLIVMFLGTSFYLLERWLRDSKRRSSVRTVDSSDTDDDSMGESPTGAETVTDGYRTAAVVEEEPAPTPQPKRVYCIDCKHV